MNILSMPPVPTGSQQQMAAQQYAYLFQLVQQLNLALGAIESGTAVSGGHTAQTAPPSTASVQALRSQVENLRSLVIKTASEVEKTTESLTAELSERYVAQSDFGSYVQTLSAYLEANPDALTQYYGFGAELKAAVGAVDAAFQHYKLDTQGYIRTGIVSYDGDGPVYGVAVGQNLTTYEVDGETVVEPSDFRALFTPRRLSFWQGEVEVAYLSDNRLYITDITVLSGLSVGPWRMESGGGLSFQWMGG
ncbi:MAG: hypothetical protein IKV99_05775 [Oscillospiraceae bacterium]|nr:hypothetical protein [Oscillospiraceae bacterium]